MSFFNAFTSSLTGSSSGSVTASPALRADIYKAIQVTETWLSRPDAPGDGVSFHQVFSIVQPHSPNLKTPIPMDEVAVLVGAITNLIFELGKVDSMAGGMTIQTWVESLHRAYDQAQAVGDRTSARRLGAGITRGVNALSDPNLVTRELTPRVQTLNSLKQVAAFVYGPGSEEARQADAYWSSKMIM